MTLVFAPETIPLTPDAAGTVRAAGLRVTLDSIVAAFDQGATAEDLVLRYPPLQLADAYFILGYYLRHRMAVDAYLAAQEQEADTVRRELEARFPQATLQERRVASSRPAERS